MDRYRVIKGDDHPYLCTCAFALWLPLFNAGPSYFQIVLDSLKFCRQKKGLVLHAYVLMIDHLHVVIRHPDVSGCMRDFKSWTAKCLVAQLQRDDRADLLRLLKLAASDTEFKVWQDGFHPKAIATDAMMLQKIEYVHQNPVRKGFVLAPEEWRYSSALNYLRGDQSVLEIDAVQPLIV